MNMQMHIVIIGAGIQGLCLLRNLKDRCKNIIVLEKNPDVGGIWYLQRNMAYSSLQNSRGHYKFLDYKPMKNNRASANEVYEYIKSYAKDKRLMKYIKFNMNVKKITDKKEIICTNGQIFLADVIACTGSESTPYIPKILKDPKKIIHTSNITQNILNSMRGKRCIIIGGSKSAAEAALYFHKNGAHVTWIAHKFYTYYRCSDPFSLPLIDLLGCLPNYTSSSNLIKCLNKYKIQKTDKIRPGSFNGLTSDEYWKLKKINTIKGKIKNVNNGVLLLNNLKQYKYDILVAATGYKYNPICLDKKYIITYSKLFPDAIATFGIIGKWLHANASSEYILNRKWENESYNTFAKKYSNKYKFKLIAIQIEYLLLLYRKKLPISLNDYSPIHIINWCVLIIIILFVILRFIYNIFYYI
jgi:hypothetical protein